MVRNVTVGTQSFTVSDMGHSGVECAECHHSYTDVETDAMTEEFSTSAMHNCPNCAHDVYGVDEFIVNVRGDNELMLIDSEAVKTMHWFHASTNADWLTTVQGEGDPVIDGIERHVGKGDTTIMVHVGSEMAARDRANVEFPSQKFYLYEIVINSDTEVAPLILEDDINIPERGYQCENTGWSAKGVTRYINVYESIGSISLLANPYAFSIVGVSKISPFTEMSEDFVDERIAA